MSPIAYYFSHADEAILPPGIWMDGVEAIADFGVVPAMGGAPDSTDDTLPVKVRKLFPESWLWSNVTVL